MVIACGTKNVVVQVVCRGKTKEADRLLMTSPAINNVYQPPVLSPDPAAADPDADTRLDTQPWAHSSPHPYRYISDSADRLLTGTNETRNDHLLAVLSLHDAPRAAAAPIPRTTNGRDSPEALHNTALEDDVDADSNTTTASASPSLSSSGSLSASTANNAGAAACPTCGHHPNRYVNHAATSPLRPCPSYARPNPNGTDADFSDGGGSRTHTPNTVSAEYNPYAESPAVVPAGGALASAATQGGMNALEELRLLKVPVLGDLMVQLKKGGGGGGRQIGEGGGAAGCLRGAGVQVCLVQVQVQRTAGGVRTYAGGWRRRRDVRLPVVRTYGAVFSVQEEPRGACAITAVAAGARSLPRIAQGRDRAGAGASQRELSQRRLPVVWTCGAIFSRGGDSEAEAELELALCWSSIGANKLESLGEALPSPSQNPNTA
ncbi:hypothetical protein C8F04DRAFT_1397512 [Mycena alexandri]|uniref:Uncharacterized protein n=1 Tax=Mycena alexandri TaxID=1745969 RepID=A0AAD6X138_9AGAR|nr:hypothetical protein C8F04DRAFT_1397512 [Mycena alexandri]